LDSSEKRKPQIAVEMTEPIAGYRSERREESLMLLKERSVWEVMEPLPETYEDPAQFVTEESIDESLEESFPASDPPSWTLGLECGHSVHEGDVREEYAPAETHEHAGSFPAGRTPAR
jgi:hypothetical protein